MPTNPNFKASFAEWRTILDALRHYADHLNTTVSNIEDEEEQLVVYDDLERLDRIIPSFQRQFDESMQQIDASLASTPSK